MKRFLAVFLTLAILLTGLTVTASAGSPWKKNGNYWTYTKSNGKLAQNEWIRDGGEWYYFNGTHMAADYVMEINKVWYAFSKNGAMVAGNWYGHEETRAKEDGTKFQDTDWYYANADGSLARGWKKIGKAWYYFDEEEGYLPCMYRGRLAEIKGTWYAFKQSGEMITGWGQPWVEDPWYSKPNTGWVYANDNGALVKGWKNFDGEWYYFRTDYPEMATDCSIPIRNGEWDASANPPYIYVFDESGVMVEKGWYQISSYKNSEKEPGAWYLIGADGCAKKGWAKDNGTWYYLDEKWGYMYSDCMATMSDGKTYAFEKNGGMVTGWYKAKNGTWYYFDANGARVEKEWVEDGGKWYYLKKGGVMARDEKLTIGKREYRFGKDGAWTGK